MDVEPDGTATFRGEHTFVVEAGMGLSGQMLGFALSPDGTKIYIGSQEDGLWSASTTDFVFTKKSSIDVQCLATRNDELWVCSAAASGYFIAGVSTDEGATFTPKLPLIGTLTGPIACAPNPQGAACNTDQNSSQCSAAFQAFCVTNSCSAPSTASPKSSSCDVARGSAPSPTMLLGGLAAVGAISGMALRRRRNKR